MAPVTPRTSWQLVRDRAFGSYLAATVVSNVGNWFQNVAAGVVVFRLTGSNTLVGTVSALQFATTLLLGPFAGALADRADRRRVVLAAEGIAAAGAAVLAVTMLAVGVDGLPGVWPILAATAVIGLRDGLGAPALNALVPSLVDEADLDRGIALHTTAFTLARAVGPALAGAVLAVGGAVVAFGLNALSFLPLLVVLALLRPRRAVPRAADRSVRAGLRYTLANPAATWLIAATMALGWAGDPVNTLAPAYADLLGRGEGFVGLQIAAFGTGAGLGILGVGPLRDRIGTTRTTAVAAAVLGAGTLGYAAAPGPATVIGALVVAGFGSLIASSTVNANLQARLDEELRGRVMALWLMAFLGSKPLAGLVDGAVADLVHPRAGVAVAVLPLGVAFWGLWRVERLDATGAA